jgi:hypothetical protein
MASRKRKKSAKCACKNPRPSPAALERAQREYVKTHWGERGRAKVTATYAADPSEPSTALGELVEVTYRTRKGGDDGLVDYVHAFKTPRPLLAFNSGGLLVLGGGYTVTERGIVR